MKEIFKIYLHSIIDVITNSSSELFVVDKSYGLEFVEKVIKEKEKEFPAKLPYHKVSIFLDSSERRDCYFDTDDAIKYLKNRGYKIIAPEVEIEPPQVIMISCEQGYISDELRKFIIETFNAKYLKDER